MKTKLPTLAILCAASLATTTGLLNADQDFTIGETAYRLVTTLRTWDAAQADAVAKGGNLVCIDDVTENDAILSNIAGLVTTTAPDGGGTAYAWIGGKETSEGTYAWAANPALPFWRGGKSGSAQNGLYENWGRLSSPYGGPEPDNYAGQNRAAIAIASWPSFAYGEQIGDAGQWNDIKGTNTLHYIIEWAPTRIIALSGNLAFANVAGGASATRPLTIKNNGNKPLVVSNIAYPTGFSGDWAGGTIAPGASQNITVTFSPTAGQTYAGMVTLTSDKTSGPNTLAISGTGIMPEITVEEPAGTDRSTGAAIDLASSAIGFTSNAKTLVIKNTGTGPLIITGIDPGGAHSSDFVLTKPRLPLSLPPKASTKVPVMLRPTAKGNRTASLTITSNDADENPFSLGLMGTGTDPHGQYAVGQGISADLPADITTLGEASSITGLPAGLKYDSKTKKLAGMPTVAGAFAAKVTVKKSDGKTTTVPLTFVVEALPAWTQGAFTALIKPPADTTNTNLDRLGGLLTLNTTSAGAYTGTLRLGAKTFPVKGQIAGVAAADRGSDPLLSTVTVVTKPGVPADNITLGLEFRAAGDPDAPGLTGNLTFGGAAPLPIGPGWQHVWNATKNPAFGNKDRTLNVALDNSELEGPQGDGFATIKVTKAGLVTWTGTLADGTPFTGSYTASPEGDLPLYVPMPYPGGGCVFGLAATELTGAEGALMRVVGIDGFENRWIKRTSTDAKDRTYQGGFDLNLDIQGAEYRPPATGQLLFGAGVAPASLDFTFAGAGATTLYPTKAQNGTARFDANLLAGNTIDILPAGLPPERLPLPKGVLASGTGILTGSSTLTDTAGTAKIVRKLDFKGLYIPDPDALENSSIAGFFLVPDLPGTGQAAASTPIQSGTLHVGGALDFGILPVGASATRTFLVHNDGTAALTVNSITPSSGFSANAPGLPISLPPGATLPVPIVFSPAGDATYDGPITFSTNLGDQTRPCSGRGIVTPDELATWHVGQLRTDSLSDIFAAYGTVESVTGLPPGMRFNNATKRLEGSATAGGSFTLAIVLKSQSGKLSSLSIPLSVTAYPVWAAGTFNGWVDHETLGLGTATMTVSNTGAMSGKLVADGKTYAFSAAGFSDLTSGGGGRLFRTDAVAGADHRPFFIEIGTPGLDETPQGLSVGICHSTAGNETDHAGFLFRSLWKDSSMAGALADYVGYYTASLQSGEPFGTGYLCLTVDASGSVKTVGKLGDGTPITSTTPLIVDERGRAMTVLYSAPASYKGGCFFLLLDFIQPENGGPIYLGAYHSITGRGTTASWVNNNPTATENEPFTFDLLPIPEGGRYDPQADLRDLYPSGLSFEALLPSLNLPVRVTGLDPFSMAEIPRVTTWTEYRDTPPAYMMPSLPITITPASGTGTGLKAPPPQTPEKDTDELDPSMWWYNYDELDNPAGLTITLDKKTGILKGSFKLFFDYISAENMESGSLTMSHVANTVNFEGVLTPVLVADPAVIGGGAGFFTLSEKGMTLTDDGRQVFFNTIQGGGFLLQPAP